MKSASFVLAVAIASLSAGEFPSVSAQAALPPVQSVRSISTAEQEAPLQMSGFPQHAADLPRGTVVVRVIVERLPNVLDHRVELRVTGSGRSFQSMTDRSGRARFSGLAVGDVVQARTTVGGETIVSQQFTLPLHGGIRLVLVADGGTGSAAARGSAGGATSNGSSKHVGPDPKTAFLFILIAASAWWAASVIWPRRRRSASWQTK
jgi:hypothetical protein